MVEQPLVTDSLSLKQLLKVLMAVKKGDFSVRMPTDQIGIAGKIADSLNDIIELNERMAQEFRRISVMVGKEGKTTQRAVLSPVMGGWAACIDSVNTLVGDLVQPTNEMARVIGAVAKGDLSQTIALEIESRPLQGEFLHSAKLVNGMVAQLGSFASEVTRVAREVGTEGKLGGQAEVSGVSGTWKDLTDNVNSMAGNLTSQVRNIAEVTTAVANGDLGKKITVDVKGEILELKNTINTMVDQLSSFASEVTRVAREVGTEGKLGGQAVVKGVGGTWKDLTDNVNSMAGNLTSQVRNIAEVTTAVANGDLGKKITVDVKGEILELKNTINTMVDQLSSFASEVTRVAREVGTEGKLGGQADVKGVGGTWKDLTDNVNSMAGNLTAQVRNIAEVTTAVANGDLGKKITVDVKGEILELKNTINTMVDQLNAFASEVTRVAREVGTEGKLGGQADVKGVGGTWKDLTDNVNSMAGNLTAQVRNIAEVTTAVANGDLGKKITVDVKGEILELKDTINTMVDQLNAFASEVTRVAREVGTEGKLGGQADVKGVGGTWKDLTDNVNSMAGNLTAQVRNIAEVTTAVANGDLGKKITVDVKGEILELKNTINTMVDQLNAFASEVTRVAREVGTEGKLGGQAAVRGVAGTWKDLTDNVNSMATNLTIQVRDIAEVVTAVANGDLMRKLVLEAKGEIAELAETINGMIDTLSVFVDQVTTVAREVGIEGKLGGQAHVPGAAGRWRDLTDNVNQLAGNLTTQVRAIADVATAVTQGDLTRSIAVEAAGEVASLKDNINEMIRNLKDTTRKNTEQDWLKTNLAKFTRMLQGQRDLLSVGKQILSELSPLVSVQHSVFYITETINDELIIKLLASYAYKKRKHLSSQFKLGEGLVGQCALEKERILLTKVPADYIQISSGLGEAAPLNIVVLPVVFENEVKAVIELGSFNRFTDVHLTFLEQLTESIGIVLNTISATTRTEDLLKQSQSLTEELRSQQEELTETNTRLEQQAKTLQQSEELLKNKQKELQMANESLEERADLLSEQKNEVERKNHEVERAKQLLEEKAAQLALTSKFKSEFLANMSHELRTPLNSLLILAKVIAENDEENLTPKQVEYAQTIYSSGADLLELINDILDLAKIESGTVAVEIGNISFADIQNFMDRAFSQIAKSKSLAFDIELDAKLPAKMRTDSKRLYQVLKNLLSNAFKFTEKGGVTLSAHLVTEGWTADHIVLNQAKNVILFTVKDSGIGIPKDKHRIIFEAFQQADGTTSRKYGGTGLGLSISRQIAYMLGGDILLHSKPGEGSTFNLYLPLDYVPVAKRSKLVENLNKEKSHTEVKSEIHMISSVTEEESLSDVMPASLSLVSSEENIQPDDDVLLIIEEEMSLVQTLIDKAHECRFKAVVTQEASRVIPLSHEFNPSAIILDLQMADNEGWVILDRLKHHALTRHIPVCVSSRIKEQQDHAFQSGAINFLQKPLAEKTITQMMSHLKSFIDRRKKKLLIVEDNEKHSKDILEHIGSENLNLTAVTTMKTAKEVLNKEAFDCMAFNFHLFSSDKNFSKKSINSLQSNFRLLPGICYTLRKISKMEEAALINISKTANVKVAGSLGFLINEITSSLHLPQSVLPKSTQRMLNQMHRIDLTLADKKVLIIDDDIRNIFALISALERHQIQAIYTENGRDGIKMLHENPDVDVILMDIMMPEMDGYETIRAIRQFEQFHTLPIIALTAKAMQGDREKCIQAGTSSYLPKPVDIEHLLSILRVCLLHH